MRARYGTRYQWQGGMARATAGMRAEARVDVRAAGQRLADFALELRVDIFMVTFVCRDVQLFSAVDRRYR